MNCLAPTSNNDNGISSLRAIFRAGQRGSRLADRSGSFGAELEAPLQIKPASAGCNFEPRSEGGASGLQLDGRCDTGTQCSPSRTSFRLPPPPVLAILAL